MAFSMCDRFVAVASSKKKVHLFKVEKPAAGWVSNTEYSFAFFMQNSKDYG